MPTFVKQTLGAPTTEHGDAATTTYRRLLRTRQRIREYETLLAKQVKPPHIHRRIEILARKLQRETRNQADVDAELERLNREYQQNRRDSWRKWQRENLVKKPGRIFAWRKRNAPAPGPGDLQCGKAETPPDMDKRLQRAKEDWTHKWTIDILFAQLPVQYFS